MVSTPFFLFVLPSWLWNWRAVFSRVGGSASRLFSRYGIFPPLVAFGNGGSAFRYSDFGRSCQDARAKNRSHSASSAMCGAKSKRGVRQLPDAALIEKVWLFPYCGEPHSHIIGARRRASFTHSIRVASPPSVAGGIDIQTIVRCCHDQRVIAVDVDLARSRPTPVETHCIYSPHLASQGGKRDRSGSWCRGRG